MSQDSNCLYPEFSRWQSFHLNPGPAIHTDLEKGGKADVRRRENTHHDMIQEH